ncbi:hypothetical protein [Caldalkalibacillus mannanilyticus]|nr:hypothetical protein [Caldalkalibacillus mannanilyticus]
MNDWGEVVEIIEETECVQFLWVKLYSGRVVKAIHYKTKEPFVNLVRLFS